MDQTNENKTFTPTQRFWKLLKPDASEVKNIYVYSIFNGLINLTLPLGIQAIINLIQGGRVSSAWIVLVVIVVLGIAFTGLLQIFQMRITENLQQKIFARAAFEFAYRLPKIKMEALYKHYAPELMNRFFDVMSVQKGLAKILITFSSAGLQVIFGLALLSFYHPFFIIFSLLLVLIVYAIFRLTAKKGLETSLLESKHKYRVAHWLEEVARTSITFKLAGKTDLPLKKIDKHVDQYIESRESHFKILVQQFSMLVFFKVIIATGLLAIGGILVMEQLMNIGQFVAAEIIIIMIMNSVEKLILNLEIIYDVLTSLEKISQVTDLDLENEDGEKSTNNDQDLGIALEMNNVWFSYPGASDFWALKELDFEITPGQRVIITGKNGTGKSTLLHVMAGMYNLQRGSISYDGLPKNNLDINSLRSIIGGCLNEEQLFEGTVLENITVGRKRATFENVQWAIKNLDLEDFIKSLPNGYDTPLDPLGKKLPQSMIQKLLIARSIADKPRLLLLEYVFEHFSPGERKNIIDFLSSEENKWTMISVTNDGYMAQNSDLIAVMNDGKIQHQGSYDEMKLIVDFKN